MNEPVFEKTWKPIPSEDIEDILKLPTFSELLGYEENSGKHEYIRSVPVQKVSTGNGNNTSVSKDTPVFGDPHSPFAASHADINHLRNFFQCANNPFQTQHYQKADLGRENSYEPRFAQQIPHHDPYSQPVPLFSQVATTAQLQQTWLPYTPSVPFSNCISNPHSPHFATPPLTPGAHPVDRNGYNLSLFQCPATPVQQHSTFASTHTSGTSICSQCGSFQSVNSESGTAFCGHCVFSTWTRPSMSHGSNTQASTSQQTSKHQRRNRQRQPSCKPYDTKKLSEFRRKRGQGYTISDVLGMVNELSKDQIGSRFLQKEIPRAHHDEQEVLVSEIIPETLQISNDVFGNFVIQKLLEFGSSKVLRTLVDIIKPRLLQLSLQKYSCRVVQKSIEALPYDFKAELAVQLDGHVETCAKNEHANHVIQRCIQHLKTEHVGFIYKAVSEHTAALAMDPYGCRVVQRTVERSSKDLHVKIIIQEIINKAVLFSCDPHANFVVQHLLHQGQTDAVNSLVERLTPHVAKLSCQKYSNNVVEVCLTMCNSEAMQKIKEQIFKSDKQTSSSVLERMVCDPFGVLIIEKIIKSFSNVEKHITKAMTVKILRAIQGDMTQKSLYKRLEKLLSLFKV